MRDISRFFFAMIILLGVLAQERQVHAQENDFFVEIARDHVDVTVGFVGDSIDIFGDRRDPSAQVVVIVEGPRKDITLWKKARVLGAWMNRYYVTFEDIPSYYNYAVSSGSLADISLELRQKYTIGYDALLDSVETKKSRSLNDIDGFKKIFYEKKSENGVYFEETESFNFMNEHFFRVGFRIPSSASTGEYTIRSLLIKDDKVLGQKIGSFKVEQVGLNAFLFNAAHKYSFVYAMICISMAAFSGWLVSVLRVRP